MGAFLFSYDVPKTRAKANTRLHTLPPPTWADQESHLTGLDRRTAQRVNHAAAGGRYCGQFQVKMGKAETFYDWGIGYSGGGFVRAGLDKRNCGIIYAGAR